jgi:hypothetical protein
MARAVNYERTASRKGKTLMRQRLALLSIVTPLALGACGNTYHPEYHPVTVSHYEQHLAYPVTVQTGASPAPVVIAPAPAPGRPHPPPPPWPPWPSE